MKKTKKIFAVLFSAVMILSLCVPAYAAQGNVTYKGQAEKFVFAPGSEKSLTDLFPDFKGVMPGDKLTQKIDIVNDIKGTIKINLYMRALGAQEGSEAFLSQMTLNVKQDGSKELFDAPSDQSAQLTDWVYLGTLYPNGKTTLDVTLNVPIEMGNDFQEKIGYLDWEFKAEEVPYTPPHDDPTPGPGPGKAVPKPAQPAPSAPPKTGDTSNVMLWVALMMVSAAAAVVIAVRIKKQK